MATGEGIDEDATLDRAHLFDVAPTIMAAMEVPCSDRMDGSVVPLVDTVGSTSYPAYDAEGDEDEARPEPDAEVTDRLTDLGYMNWVVSPIAVRSSRCNRCYSRYKYGLGTRTTR